ncbi:unnamed protein product [Mytilus coruscus]|uniref:Uncharacterized protein n=1 Tax=Mytilus coruscus TaxID=42192 RepID=A0A6J8E0N1_MYTCO|nr:unnamed protein product [Mytilus coruscus]
MQNIASDRDAKEVYSTVMDIATDIEFIVPITPFTKNQVKPLQAAFIENQISSCKDEINQFIEGLDTTQVMSLLLQPGNRASARSLFTTKIYGIKVQPKDVMMWLTGSTIIPAIGFHKLIDVNFADSTFVNTCALALTLKTHPDLSSEDAVSYYTELIINSQTFTKE